MATQFPRNRFVEAKVGSAQIAVLEAAWALLSGPVQDAQAAWIAGLTNLAVAQIGSFPVSSGGYPAPAPPNGQLIVVEEGVMPSVGTNVGGATASALLGVDGSGNLVSGPSTAAVASGGQGTTAVKTGAYNIAAADGQVLGDTSASAFPFTLPAATGSGTRKKLGVYPASVLDTPNLLSVLTSGADTIGDYNLAAPVLSSVIAAAASGALDAATYYYVVTAVNEIGETLASNERSAVVAASLLPAPVQTAPSTSTTGGALGAAQTYVYVVTALNAAGESSPSNMQTITTGAGSTNENTINWNAVAGATGYKVYRSRNNSLPMQMYSVGNVTTYVDGAAWTSANNGTPPDVNLTGSKITVTWAAVPQARFYRVYRGTSTGGESYMYEEYGTSYVDQALPALGQLGPPAINGTLLTLGTPRSGAPYRDVDLVDAAAGSWRLS